MIWKDEKDFWEFRNSKKGKTPRFWQALQLFADVDKIEVTYHDGTKHDTFYFQDVKIEK